MAGSERPEGSLLFWVEWRESCDVHPMAAPASQLQERAGGLRHYEGTGGTDTHFTAMQLLTASTPKSLIYVLILESFFILTRNSSAPKFGINQKTSSEVSRHQEERKQFLSAPLFVWWKFWSRNFTLNSFPWFQQRKCLSSGRIGTN